MMLQNQLEQTNDVLDEILASLQGLQTNTTKAKLSPRPTVFEFWMNSSGQATYQTSGSLAIVRLLFTTDTTSPFCLQIGTDRSHRFKCSNTQVVVELAKPETPIFVARGVPMTFVQIGGAGAVWDAWGWARNEDYPGQVNVRQ
jgi:hypothetical protein